MRILFRKIDYSDNLLSKLLRVFINCIFFLGAIVFLYISLTLISNQLAITETLKKIEKKFFDHFVQLNHDFYINSVDEFVDYLPKAIEGYFFTKKNILEFDLQIKQKNIYKLYQEDRKWINAKFDVAEDANNILLNGRIRTKGDRTIHREIKKQSYRVNLKKDNFFNGMEEFSIQRGIIRNYSWEPLFHRVASSENILTLKYGLLKLSINGDSKGVYTFEEVPSKYTIERTQRKNGPIFGLDENERGTFPTVTYEVYDKNDWEKNNTEILAYADTILNETKFLSANLNYKNSNTFLEQYYDLDKWAKFFALSDLFRAYHGTIPKSVKLYFNPITGKIEPLVFDAHIGTFNQGSWSNGANFKFIKGSDFSLIDFMVSNNPKCGFICSRENWFKFFFNENNISFLDKYNNHLARYITDEFIENIGNIYKTEVSYMDRVFYSELSDSDDITQRGLGLYHFNFDYLNNNINNLRLKVEILKDFLEFNNKKTDTSGQNNTNFININPRIINAKNLTIKGVELIVNEPTVYLLSGSTTLEGQDLNNKLNIFGPIMFVQESGKIKINNVIIENGQAIKIHGRELSGVINIIDSEADIKSLFLKNTYSEDAINIVNSNANLDKIYIENTQSDALDVDFSNINIGEVSCKNITNDCLDFSNSNGNVDYVYAEIIGDKVLSVGEKSFIKFKSVTASKAGIGVAVKDASNVTIQNLSLKNTDLEISLFIKKKEFGQPKLKVDSFISDRTPLIYTNSLKHISINSSSNDFEYQLLKSSEIQDKMYGAKYGAKTVK
jgi:hypothetical protein